MRYIKIEITVRPELAASILDLVKTDVVALHMTMLADDNNPSHAVKHKRKVARAKIGDHRLPGSAACALNIMRGAGRDRVWSSAALGRAMAAEGYAATGGSPTITYLTRAGLAERNAEGLVILTNEGWENGKA